MFTSTLERYLVCLVLGIVSAATLLLRRSKPTSINVALLGCVLILAAPSLLAAQTTMKVQDPDGDGLRQIFVNPRVPSRTRVDTKPKLRPTRNVRIVHRNPVHEQDESLHSTEPSPWADSPDSSWPNEIGNASSATVPALSVAAATGFAEVQVLGKAITWGPGGAVPVRLEVEVGAGNGFVPLFGGNDVSVGTIQQIDLGVSLAEVTFRATAAWPNFASPTWTRTVKSSETNAILLVNADNLNGVMAQRAVQPPYGGLLPLSEVVRNYVDQNSVVHLDNNRILLAFELGTTNPASAAYDFQDLVIAVDLDGIVQAPDFYLADQARGFPYSLFPVDEFHWSMVRSAPGISRMVGVAYSRTSVFSDNDGDGLRSLHACILPNANFSWVDCDGPGGLTRTVYTAPGANGERFITQADMALADNGLVGIAWIEVNGSLVVNYKAAFSSDFGNTWSSPAITLGSYTNEGRIFSPFDIDVAVNDDGKIGILAYFDQAPGANPTQPNSLVLYVYDQTFTQSIVPVVTGAGASFQFDCVSNCFSLTGDSGNIFHAFYNTDDYKANVATFTNGVVGTIRSINNSGIYSLSAARSSMGATYYVRGGSAYGLYDVPTSDTSLIGPPRATSFVLPGDLDDSEYSLTARIVNTSNCSPGIYCQSVISRKLDEFGGQTTIADALNDTQTVPWCPTDEGFVSPGPNCYRYLSSSVNGFGGVVVGDVYYSSSLLVELHWVGFIYEADRQRVVIHQTTAEP